MYAESISNREIKANVTQKSSNNRLTGKFLSRKIDYSEAILRKNNPIQTKMEIGSTNDKYEREADSVADKIVNMNDTQVSKAEEKEEVQTKSISESITAIQKIEEEGEEKKEEPQTKLQMEEEKKEEPQTKLQMEEEKKEPQEKLQMEEEKKEPQEKLQMEEEKKEEQEEAQLKIQKQEEEEKEEAQPSIQKQEEEKKEEALSGIQRKSNHERRNGNNVEDGLNMTKTGGNKLPENVLNNMESRFSSSFDNVKIHTDETSVQMNKQIGAQAFTYGNHIYFGNNKYDPGTTFGNRLLAHELTHVIQQGKASSKKSVDTKVSTSKGINRRIQTAPQITGVVADTEIGVGRSMRVSATVAGHPRINWSLVGGPAGVTISGRRRTATIRSTAASLPAAGGNFTVNAELASNAADSAVSNPITLVGITNVNFTPAPAFQTPVPALIPATGPVDTVEPNRNGVAGNSANTVITSVPGGSPTARPMTVTLRRDRGAAVAGLAITPGTTTGDISLRVSDNVTGTSRDATLPINPVVTRLNGFTAQVAHPTRYGVRNTLRFASSHTFPTALFNRIVGEAMTNGGRDDFNIMPIFNGTGPNPAPRLNLAVPANTWRDNLVTFHAHPAAAPADQKIMNVNRYVGPGVADRLPRQTNVRQGFHWISWAGAWSNEFDHGFQRRTLRQLGPNSFGFRTEHLFPGANANPFDENYITPYPGVASPLINLTNVVATPLVPVAQGIAADGLATAELRVNTTHAGRNVHWSVINGAIAFTLPALGAAHPVGNAATIVTGLTAGRSTVRVQDAVFQNRQIEARIRTVPVELGRINGPRRVPAGTNSINVTVNADPGGRVVNWAIDAASTTAGVTIVPDAVVGPDAALPARTAQVNRPAGYTGNVTITVSDNIRNAARSTKTIRFR